VKNLWIHSFYEAGTLKKINPQNGSSSPTRNSVEGNGSCDHGGQSRRQRFSRYVSFISRGSFCSVALAVADSGSAPAGAASAYPVSSRENQRLATTAAGPSRVGSTRGADGGGIGPAGVEDEVVVKGQRRSNEVAKSSSSSNSGSPDGIDPSGASRVWASDAGKLKDALDRAESRGVARPARRSARRFEGSVGWARGWVLRWRSRESLWHPVSTPTRGSRGE
jgi:hypothetical protein